MSKHLMLWATWAGIAKQIGKFTTRMEVAGSYARKEEEINDLDIVLETTKESIPYIVKDLEVAGLKKVKGGDRMAIFTLQDRYWGELQIDLYFVYPPRNFHMIRLFRTLTPEDVGKLREGLEKAGHLRPHGEVNVSSMKEALKLAGFSPADFPDYIQNLP